MPKLNAIQTYERLEKCLRELEAGKSFQTRMFAGLLSEATYQQLRDAVSNRKHAKLTVHEVQLTFISNAFKKLKANLHTELDTLVKQREARAARIYLDAYFATVTANEKCLSLANPKSVGNAALRRNAFNPISKYTGLSFFAKPK